MDVINKFILNASLSTLLLMLASFITGAPFTPMLMLMTIMIFDRLIEQDKWFTVRIFLSVCAFYAIIFSTEMLKILMGWLLA